MIIWIIWAFPHARFGKLISKSDLACWAHYVRTYNYNRHRDWWSSLQNSHWDNHGDPLHKFDSSQNLLCCIQGHISLNHHFEKNNSLGKLIHTICSQFHHHMFQQYIHPHISSTLNHHHQIEEDLWDTSGHRSLFQLCSPQSSWLGKHSHILEHL